MLFFIFGEDTYRSRKKLQDLKEKFLKSQKRGGPAKSWSASLAGQAGGNLFHLSAEEITPELLKKVFSSQQLFSQKKLTIIENLFSLKKDLIEKISDFIHGIERDKNNNLILFETKIERKKFNQATKKLFDKLKKIKYSQEFPLLSSWQLKAFIKKNFLKDAAIEEKALDLLIEFLGNNLWAIKNELDKLVSLHQRKKIIKEEEIKKLVLKTNQEIFKLIDAIGDKRKKIALKLLNEQIESGISIEDILYLVGRQYGIILKMKAFLQNEHENIFEFSKKIGIHPYVAQKAKEEENKYDLEELKKIYRDLLKIDFLRKTNPIDPKILLNLLIVKNL